MTNLQRLDPWKGEFKTSLKATNLEKILCATCKADQTNEEFFQESLSPEKIKLKGLFLTRKIKDDRLSLPMCPLVRESLLSDSGLISFPPEDGSKS
eukprot:CAMPEP_0170549892 /NCGR_PEP_ID=MMETSP0211-20121228/8001_1 /TAXON_ID=311385 /ORGANISM="Pseudokeronopsis sp., Strain OXSARD2" /LENGTH=95 /DNA_ID=CAMNT_0010856143 /DNA_START=104 /DNA_END=391 /DNA_ORIENTATION=+